VSINGNLVENLAKYTTSYVKKVSSKNSTGEIGTDDNGTFAILGVWGGGWGLEWGFRFGDGV